MIIRVAAQTGMPVPQFIVTAETDAERLLLDAFVKYKNINPVTFWYHGTSYACGRDGAFEGRFDRVDIDNAEIELEGQPVGLRWLDKERVRIGRCIFRHNGWSEWVGN